MSTLSRAFLRRAAIAVGGLALAIVLLVVREAFGGASCTTSLPYAPNSPVVMTCSRPLEIVDYDQSSYLMDSLKDGEWVIVPVRPWTGQAFEFSYQQDALPFIHRLSLPVSSPPPTVFFTDGAGASKGMVLAATDGNAPGVATVFSAPGSTHVRFDGLRYFTYLKDDESHGGRPSVSKYDPAARESTIAVLPPLGKTITDFFPSINENVRALAQKLENGKESVSTMNGTVEGISQQWIALDMDTVFASPIFAPDGITLSVIDRTRNRLDLYDTMGYFPATHSSSPKEPIVGHGFIGEKSDIPVFWTEKGLWSLGEGSWSFLPMPGLLKAGACSDGKTYILTKVTLRDDSGPLATAPSGWSFEDLAVTTNCTPFILSKETSSGSEKIQIVSHEALHDVYSSAGPISFVGHD